MITQSIVEALARAPSIVVPLVRQAAPTILKTRPPSGKWSVHEHACHLANVHTLFVHRLDLMLAEDDPVIQSYDPGRDDPDDRLLQQELEEALQRFTIDRTRLVERLRRLQPVEWTRTARHDEYNSYSVFTMFRHLALHDFFHAYRIEELVLRRDWPAPAVPGK
jgi:uncharacterized damage-inducible protein DinB